MISIRKKLIIWQCLLLSCLVVVFGAVLDHRISAQASTDLDHQLAADANQLSATLDLQTTDATGKTHHQLTNSPKGSPAHRGGPWWKQPGGLPPGQQKKRQSVVVNNEKLSLLLARRPDLSFAVWNVEKRLIKSSTVEPECGFTALRHSTSPLDGNSHPLTIDGYRCVTVAGAGKSQLVICRSLKTLANEQAQSRQTIFLIGLSVLAAGLLGALILSRQIVRPIERMAAAAAGISVGNTQRLTTDNTPQELVNLCKPINDAFDRLDQSYQREKLFAANASHELRTPLAVLMSQTELVLSRERSTTEYRQGLEVCAQAVNRMNGLVQRLMMTCGKHSELTPQLREIDLREIVLECVKQLKPSAHHRHIQVNTQLDAATLHGDPGLLGQMVTHLIMNAICHNNEEGTVSVTLSNHATSIQLSVADNGPGIPDDEQDRAFDPFYRTDSSRTREDKTNHGFGLGLTICENVAAAHDGGISLTSKLDNGTTVCVSLPKKSHSAAQSGDED